MIEVEVTWKIALRIWWSFFWRAFLFSFLIGAAIGFVIGLIYGIVFGVTPNQVILSFIGYGVGAIVSLLVFKQILHKRYPKYRVAVVEA